MLETIQIRLQRGDSEIEVQGTRKDVDELLAKWWTTSNGLKSKDPTKLGIRAGDKSRKARGRGTRKRLQTESDDSGFDPVSHANAIKESDDYGSIERMLRSRSRWCRVSAVLALVDSPLTSGEIHKILGQLNVKMSLPHVSQTLKDNSKSLLTDGVRRRGVAVRYSLSSSAKQAFARQLKKSAA